MKIGDRVKLKELTTPYYSGYAGNPVVIITPDKIGTVAAVDVPNVHNPGTFVCVDFLLDVHNNARVKVEGQTNLWRCGVPANRLVVVNPNKSSTRQTRKTRKPHAKLVPAGP